MGSWYGASRRPEDHSGAGGALNRARHVDTLRPPSPPMFGAWRVHAKDARGVLLERGFPIAVDDDASELRDGLFVRGASPAVPKGIPRAISSSWTPATRATASRARAW